MPTIKAGNIAKGMYVLFKNAPCLVVKAEFYHPGKGSAVNRVKYRNVKTGSVVDFTYKSNEQVEYIEVNSKEMQFLYKDGDELVFMDPRTYEQLAAPASLLETFQLKLLTPDVKVYLAIYNEDPIAINLPPKVRHQVAQAPDAVAGNTVGGAKKTVITESGYEVLTPIFIKVGDTITIDSETGNYVNRE